MPTIKKSVAMKSNTSKSVELKKPEIELGSEYCKVPNELLGTKLNPYLYGDNELFIRPFKTGEIRRISQITDDNSEELVNEVMSKVIKIKGDLTYNDIKSVDKLSLVFLCRTLTYPDPNFVINYTCDNEIEKEDKKDKKDKKVLCGASNKLHFDMEDVNIKYIKEDLGDKDFTFKTTKDITIKFRMPTIGDETLIEQHTDGMKHILKKEDKVLDEDILSIACIIEDINDEDLMKNIKGIYDYLNDLAPSDFIKLKSKFDKLHCGVDTIIKATCEECGGTVLVPVMFSSEFFLPEYND